ncbi:MAG TPA: SsrA-binding protein SmpB [Burkholderiaceae bacterium]|nr:SsrA-binding protein SmpB [Burkholderiaceae bacterium]HPE01632.1 SsrA-binding protein SmpB [Burkholderiaceae bacterium]HRZ01384.1 SsrA-binding protein SmpB [Burkholderiaceae bacterium]
MAIVQNRKAQHDYSIEERFEAGLVLKGWEVKSIRAGRSQIKESHVIIRGAELFLLNAHVTPLPTASTHEKAEPARTRKLLMHGREIAKLIGKVERAGYTLVPLDLHFSKGRVKLAMGLAKGKRQFEKRADESDRQWKREQERLLKSRTR